MSKLTVQVSDEMNEILGELAGRRGLAKTQVLRRAVALLKYLDEEAATQDLVLRNRETGQERHIVLEGQVS